MAGNVCYTTNLLCYCDITTAMWHAELTINVSDTRITINWHTCNSLGHDLSHLAAGRDHAHARLVDDQHFPLRRLHRPYHIIQDTCHTTLRYVLAYTPKYHKDLEFKNYSSILLHHTTPKTTSRPILHSGTSPLPSNGHHRSNGDCLEGKGENYQVCSVQYCVQQLYTVQHSAMHTHMNRPNSSLDWVCLTGPISLCLDSFFMVYYCVLYASVGL